MLARIGRNEGGEEERKGEWRGTGRGRERERWREREREKTNVRMMYIAFEEKDCFFQHIR